MYTLIGMRKGKRIEVNCYDVDELVGVLKKWSYTTTGLLRERLYAIPYELRKDGVVVLSHVDLMKKDFTVLTWLEDMKKDWKVKGKEVKEGKVRDWGWGLN